MIYHHLAGRCKKFKNFRNCSHLGCLDYRLKAVIKGSNPLLTLVDFVGYGMGDVGKAIIDFKFSVLNGSNGGRCYIMKLCQIFAYNGGRCYIMKL